MSSFHFKKAFAKTVTITSLIFCSSSALALNKSETEIAVMKSELSNLQRSLGELNRVVKAQQEQIEQLKLRLTAAKSTVSTTANESNLGEQAVSVTNAKPSGSYIPDIGVIADIVGTSTQRESEEEGNDRFAVRELEFVFSHDVDPYSTMNVVATFSDFEDPAVEEANITYFGLPKEIKARIGRMRPRIGKASSSHRDSLDTVDEPLVVQKYFGIEGLYKSGLELSGFTPLSVESYTQELVAGLMEGGTGEGGDLFDQTRRYPTLYTHLANFLEISDVSSFELGGTLLAGAQDPDSQFEAKAFGIDATYSYYFNAINKLKLQSETYLQNRGNSSYLAEDKSQVDSRTSPYGFYALADYRLADRWATGLRYDYVELTYHSDAISQKEEAFSTYLTFLQSELARWRIQYEHLQSDGGMDDNRFFLQGTFAIGAHKHSLN